ncbi:nuclear transport factor 2 family protein [Vibrio sp. RC27]
MKVDSYSQELALFVSTYSNLNTQSLERLGEVYHENIRFEDPAHQIEGLDNLIAYFQSMLLNTHYCHFDIHSADQIENRCYLIWNMNFSHPKLNNGKEISVPGMSYIEFDQEKVSYHRDHFDLGCMVYQHIPVLRQAVNMVKRRLAQ